MLGKWGLGSIHFLILMITVAATSFFFANPVLTYGEDTTWNNFPVIPPKLIELFPLENFDATSSGCKNTEFYPEFSKLYFLKTKAIDGNPIFAPQKDFILSVNMVFTIPKNFVDQSTCLDDSKTQIAIYDRFATNSATKEFSCGDTTGSIVTETQSISTTYEESSGSSHEFSWTVGVKLRQEIGSEPYKFTAEQSFSESTTNSLWDSFRYELTADNQISRADSFTSTVDAGKIKKTTQLQKVVHVKQSVWKATSFNPENWELSPQVDTSVVSDVNPYRYNGSICKESDWEGYYPPAPFGDPIFPSCVPAANINKILNDLESIEIEHCGPYGVTGRNVCIPLEVDIFSLYSFWSQSFSDIKEFTLTNHERIHPALVGTGSEEPLPFDYSLAYKSIENPSTLFGFTSLVQEIPVQFIKEHSIERVFDCFGNKGITIPDPSAKEKLKIWGVPSLGNTQVIVTDQDNFAVEDVEVIVDAYSFPLVEDQKACFSAETRLNTDNYGSVHFVIGHPEATPCEESINEEITNTMITAIHPDHLPASVNLVWENDLWNIVELPDTGPEPPTCIEPEVLDAETNTCVTPEPDPESPETPDASWVRITAGWWKNDQTGDSDFINSLTYLIEEDIIQIPNLPPPSMIKEEKVPPWFKDAAGWWAEELTSDKEFYDSIKHMVKIGVIQVKVG